MLENFKIREINNLQMIYGGNEIIIKDDMGGRAIIIEDDFGG